MWREAFEKWAGDLKIRGYEENAFRAGAEWLKGEIEEVTCCDCDCCKLVNKKLKELKEQP